MSPSLAELVPLSETLNSESNDLNKTIVTFNAKLAALNLGIEVWLQCPFDENTFVGFAKNYEGPGKEPWELVYRFRESVGHNALLGASRDIRIEGLKLVPVIVQRLKDEAEQRIRAMKEAKELAASL